MKTVALVLLMLALGPVSVMADDVVKFKGGIGVIPVSSGAGTAPTATVVNRNIVRGVQPAGQIWVIRELEAEVEAGGRIKVEGRGLLLGGGNNIGFNANANVLATLICEAAAPFIERNTSAAGVPLAANGDFEIDDLLSPAPTSCPSPVLLIRNASNRGWFAAGIPQ